MSKNHIFLAVETLFDTRTTKKMKNSLAGQKHIAAISIVPQKQLVGIFPRSLPQAVPSVHVIFNSATFLALVLGFVNLFPGFLPVTFSAVNIETRGQICLPKGLGFVDISPRDRCEHGGFSLVDWHFVGRSVDILHSV
jgi:hypothetical protein